MENIDYIERYFKGENDDAQKQEFENKILHDPSFAEDVSFYISATGAIQQQLSEEKKQRFKEMYKQQKVISIQQPVKQMWRYMAAASVVIAVSLLSWFYFATTTSPQQLADKYIQQNFTTLGVTMGSQDSLQNALSLYNSGKLPDALVIFERLANQDASNDNAKKYAGIVSLRLNNYDKALQYFTMLEEQPSLYSNPGKFYKAITLLKRNKNGDKEAAKNLLQQVADKDLEGKEAAQQWLSKMH